MDADAYHAALAALLPPGLPWPREPGTRLQQLLASWSDTLARIDARAAALIEETDPRTAVELLGDWETAYGLPDPCLSDTTPTTAARRSALLSRILDQGGQRPQDYLDLCTAFGYSATLTEYRPWTVDGAVDDAACDVPWAYAWRLHLPILVSPIAWPVDGTVAEPLGSWSAPTALLCLLRRRKPAHSTLILTYEV